MSFFKQMRALFAQGCRDVRDFFEFRRVVDIEMANPASVFNKHGLYRNRIGNVIYKTVDIPREYMLTDGYGPSDQYYYVMDTCRPLFDYFQNRLNFGEYMLTDVYHYEADDQKDGECILTFQIEFVFKPIALTRPLFWFYLCVTLVSVIGIVWKLADVASANGWVDWL